MAGPEFNAKHIQDPIHGTIGLSKLEAAILATPSFQRLHSIKQLGFVPLVYNGANYSRFEHSVGACHVMGTMIDAIERNTKKELGPNTKRDYRLMALLHDLGHYPYSPRH